MQRTDTAVYRDIYKIHELQEGFKGNLRPISPYSGQRHGWILDKFSGSPSFIDPNDTFWILIARKMRRFACQ
jgi:hypothetical protein